MSRFLKEPLLHFLLVGAVLFACYDATVGWPKLDAEEEGEGAEPSI
mgnify:CR=1 FL=1